MKRKGLALMVAMIMVTSLVTPAFAASMPFADVPKDHWAYDSVAELTASGLIIGYPDGTFKGERQFTRYEMAMVFARVLGRLDTLIAAEVGAELKAGAKGLSDDIYDKVAQALVEEVAKAKAELAAHVDTELANVELPEAKVVERVVVETPVEVERPFELTDEAKAVIAKVVADMVAENIAGLEPRVVEKLVEAEPGLTAKDLQGLMAAVANAQSTADFNAMDIEEIQADIAAARKLIDELTFDAKVTEFLVDAADEKADAALAAAEAAGAAAGDAQADAAAAVAAADEAKADADVAIAIAAEAKSDAADALADAGVAVADAAGARADAQKAVVDAAGAKVDAAEAKAVAADAKATATSATETALAALKGADAAAEKADAALTAVDSANQEIRNLGIAIAALEGDVIGLHALLEDTARALESEIAGLAEEFAFELASLGVRISDLEAIVVDNTARIDALEDDLAEHKAQTLDDIIDLRMADIFIQEQVYDVADAQAETAEHLAVVDAEQKATAAEFADFVADHEKVKLSGSTETVFKNISIVGDDAIFFGGDDKDALYKDPRDWDDDETYKRTAKLEQKFKLTLEAMPAEGVSVKATLADTLNVFGDKDDADTGFDLSNISLELATDKALRSLYAGKRDEEDVVARYNEFIIDDEPGDIEVVAANVVLGKLDTEIQLMRPWGDAFPAQKANYAVLVDSAFALSDAFVIDLQYARTWPDVDATDGGMPLFEDDWAYSLGIRGELPFADYSAAYATNYDEKTGYKLSVGKAYGPAPEGDADDNRPTWDVTYKSVDEGYATYLAGDVDDVDTDLSLSADNFDLLGLTLGGAYRARSFYGDPEVTAMKFTAAKKDLLLKGLTVSGQYANITNDAVADGSSLLGKIAFEPTIGALKLGASYEYASNAVDGDFYKPDKWLETKPEAGGDAVPETTIALSAEYPLEILDTTITGFIGYENRTSELDTLYGRQYVDPLLTYKVTAERALGTANVMASYRHRTGGPDDVGTADEGKKPKLDRTADFKLTYPVIGDADLVLAYRWMDVEAYDPLYDHTVNEVNCGLKFTF